MMDEYMWSTDEMIVAGETRFETLGVKGLWINE